MSPPIQIPVADTFLCGNEKKYVLEALESGWISSIGPHVKKFEEAFARYVGVSHAGACSNGTTALQLAYHACGIAKGDEVIMPNFTFVATANAATYLGAKPVFVDVDEKTWNIDVHQIEAKISPKTKAIVPVHIYGVPCDMARILKIAKKHGLKVIEDCAESHGASFGGKRTGSMGHASAYSFFGNKIITTGEGGMVTTDDDILFERVQFLKSHAMDRKRRYFHPEVGYNFRMTALQAAFGLGQLEGIDSIIAHKQRIAQRYCELLADVPGISFQEDQPGGKRVHWLFNIRIGREFGKTRPEVEWGLAQQGIDSRNTFIPMTDLPMYHEAEGYPVSHRISEEGLSLPTGAALTESQIQTVAEAIRKMARA